MTIVCIHSMLHLYGGVNTSFFVVVVVVVVVVVEYIAMHKQPHSDWFSTVNISILLLQANFKIIPP